MSKQNKKPIYPNTQTAPDARPRRNDVYSPEALTNQRQTRKGAGAYLKIASIALGMVFLAQSCSIGGPKQPQQQASLIWWQTFDDTRIARPLIDAFQKANPGIQIKFVQKSVDTYEDELIDALAAGSGPDIFAIHNDWLPKHQDKMTPAPAKILSVRDFQDGFVDVADTDLLSGEQIFGVPLSGDVLALYYNKDILSSAGIAQPPATWEELVGMTGKITRSDSRGEFTRSAVAMGTSDNVNRAPDILGALMLQNGTQFYSQSRTSSSLSQAARDEQGKTFLPAARALEFYTQFSNPSKVTYTWNAQSNNSIEAFAAGKVAMIFSYAYLRPILKTRAPFLNYGVAPLPQLTADGNKINYANYWALSVSKQSKNPDAAWTFLKYASSAEGLRHYYEVQKQPAPRPDLISEQQGDADVGVFAEGALTAKSFYKPDSDAIEAIFVEMIDNVTLRNIEPEDAIQAANQKINLLLRSR